MTAPRPPLRIANSSGFYGDRLAAPFEMLRDGPIDVLTGDYLAELTMLILWKARRKDASGGYAVTFLKQMEQALGLALERGVRIVTNAGGLNPGGLADALRGLARRLGLAPRIAHVEGDDLLDRLAALQAAGHPRAHLDTGRPRAELGRPVATANAYLGAWPIVEALGSGADVVVCGRVADASLVVGPAAWHFGWGREDWDRLAGAVVAGHVLECGAQATGGNYAFFREVPNLAHPGFPIAEVRADGSAVVTKHPGTGGRVSIGTVTAQLLYEIDGPRYPSPDVVARFDTIRLDEEGPDRVRISGVRGEPAPPNTKVCLNYLGGYRNTMTLVLTGLEIEEKAALARRALFAALGGEERFAEVDVRLVRADRPDAPSEEAASAFLRVTVKDPDPGKVGRAFSGAAVEMALASYPGFFATAVPGEESAYGVYWPALVPAEVLEPVVVLDDGTRRPVAPAPRPGGAGAPAPIPGPPGPSAVVPDGATRRVPLGTVFGARSGDKGGNANVGVWARSAAGYAWLAATLTVPRFKELLPEAEPFVVRRSDLPNLMAVNFVVEGLLGEGVASSVRFDPQAKALGEYLRSRLVDLPEALLADAP
ncbi:MAG TPA: acyclic terpene utilization AtuA family protein [Vicinamibacteria bacterium]|nr:acyclic terpene utilization AtuA family protein [Vicinamibacteria bacterium]